VGIGGHDLLKMDSIISWLMGIYSNSEDPVEIPDRNSFYHDCLVGQGYSTDFIVIIKRTIANEKI
jgi:hypothetical protein